MPKKCKEKNKGFSLGAVLHYLVSLGKHQPIYKNKKNGLGEESAGKTLGDEKRQSSDFFFRRKLRNDPLSRYLSLIGPTFASSSF